MSVNRCVENVGLFSWYTVSATAAIDGKLRGVYSTEFAESESAAITDAQHSSPLSLLECRAQATWRPVEDAAMLESAGFVFVSSLPRAKFFIVRFAKTGAKIHTSADCKESAVLICRFYLNQLADGPAVVTECVD